MTSKTNIPAIVRVVYFSPSGKDTNSGHSPEIPLFQGQSAADEAGEVLPAATPALPVWIHSDGDSTEIELTEGIFCILDGIDGDIVTNDECGLNAFLVRGDITVNSGSILTCFLQAHTGSITNNGTINGIIDGKPFGSYRQKHEEQVVLNASSFSTQNPSGTDSVMQIEFGAAQFGSSDPVELSVAGAITINQSDQYNVSVVVEFGRTGASGSFALVFFRILIDGVQFGNSRFAQLDNPNGAFPVQLSAPLDLLATEVLTIEFWRDSSGFDAGSLLSKTPALGGTNPAPSASIIMTRNRNIQPI